VTRRQPTLRGAALGLVLVAAAGCSTIATDPRDPFEGFNRVMYAFNDGLDEVAVKPVSRAYKAVAPEPLRGMVRNFFSNIDDIFNGLNNLLQGKPLDAVTDWARFTFNTVFGVFGINDVASDMGLEKHNEDFGQTFAVWGVGDGPYLVLPFFGPYTLRDSGGLVLDWELDPVVRARPIALRNSLIATRFVSKRTDLLDASRVMDEAALDRYVFLRDAYLQRRRSLIYDGNPPRAAREAPLAEAESEPAAAADARSSADVVRGAEAPPSASAQTPAAPATAPQPAATEAVEAAVRLLEAPAAVAPTSGG